MMRATPKQIAQVLLRLSDRYSIHEIRDALRTLLARTNRSQDLPRVMASLKELVDKDITLVEVAEPLTPDQEATLARVFGKNEWRVRVNRSLYGGIRVHKNGTVIDRSWRTRINRLKEQLTEA